VKIKLTEYGEEVIVECEDREITIKNSGFSKNASSKIKIGKDELKLCSQLKFEETIDNLIKNAEENSLKGRCDNTKEFLLYFVPRVAKALRISPENLIEIMELSRDYCFVNYYNPCNFYDFPTADMQNDKIMQLYQEISDLKKRYQKEIDDLKRKLNKANKIKSKATAVKVQENYSIDYYLHCPYCDNMMCVDDNDIIYNVHECGSDNIKCDECEKIFTIFKEEQ